MISIFSPSIFISGKFPSKLKFLFFELKSAFILGLLKFKLDSFPSMLIFGKFGPLSLILDSALIFLFKLASNFGEIRFKSILVFGLGPFKFTLFTPFPGIIPIKLKSFFNSNFELEVLTFISGAFPFNFISGEFISIFADGILTLELIPGIIPSIKNPLSFVSAFIFKLAFGTSNLGPFIFTFGILPFISLFISGSSKLIFSFILGPFISIFGPLILISGIFPFKLILLLF